MFLQSGPDQPGHEVVQQEGNQQGRGKLWVAFPTIRLTILLVIRKAFDIVIIFVYIFFGCQKVERKISLKSVKISAVGSIMLNMMITAESLRNAGGILRCETFLHISLLTLST